MKKKHEKVYRHGGNYFVAQKINNDCKYLLDIGCGAGDNASLLRKIRTHIKIDGVTLNEEEKTICSNFMECVYVFDIEKENLPIINKQYDCLLFSHVLEHTKYPNEVIEKFLPLLTSRGSVIIAIPNISEFRTRIKMLFGYWKYKEYGVFDNTHIRFYNWSSITEDLISSCFLANNNLKIDFITGEAVLPFGPLRDISILNKILKKIDSFVVMLMPNLFAFQIVVGLSKIS